MGPSSAVPVNSSIVAGRRISMWLRASPSAETTTLHGMIATTRVGLQGGVGESGLAGAEDDLGLDVDVGKALLQGCLDVESR